MSVTCGNCGQEVRLIAMGTYHCPECGLAGNVIVVDDTAPEPTEDSNG